MAAYDWLTERNNLDKEQRQFLKYHTFKGNEIVASTRRLALMNLFLHNIGDIDSDNFISPNDSLIADSGERFDYILANPPFMSPKGGIRPHSRFAVQAKRSETSVEVRINEAVLARYRDRYAAEPLVQVGDAAPWVSRIAHAHHVELGGFALADDGRRLVVVATEDNLLKGAATQALQNLNLAFGFDELDGIPLVSAAPEAT